MELASISFSAAALKEVLEKLQEDDSVTCCSLGEDIIDAAKKCVAHISTSQVEKFAETVVTELKGLLCCNKSKKRRIKLFQFWRKFHVMRLSPTIRDALQECVDSLNLNNSIKNITMHEANITTVNAISVNVEGMTVREENVVRYVAGYVVCKVKKKFSEHAEFLGAFKGGFILDFTEDDLDDYTRVWTEQVDRGGLSCQ